MSQPSGPSGPAPVIPAPAPVGSERGPWAVIEGGVAAVVIALFGFRVTLVQSATVGMLFALALLPIWISSAWRHMSYRWLVLASAAAVVAGLWLTWFASISQTTSWPIAFRNSVYIAAVPTMVGFFIWARGRIGMPGVAAAFGLSWLAFNVVTTPGAYSGNPWKFGLAMPISIVLLGLIARRGRGLQIAALVTLAVASVLNDSRSLAGIMLVAAAVLVWEGRPRVAAMRQSLLRTLVVLGTLGVSAFLGVQSLILDGAFGEATQQRSEAQIEQSGSLLVGGRPEIGAFFALLRHDPTGFGSGTVLNSTQILVAKKGMAATGYEPNNGYVENFLFGGQTQLHSVAGDLWAWCGLAGLLLVGVYLLVVARGTLGTVASATSTGLLIFLAARFIWDVAFSPFGTSFSSLALLLGLGIGAAWQRPTDLSRHALAGTRGVAARVPPRY